MALEQTANVSRPSCELSLTGWRAWSASGFCALIVMLAFLFPLMQLIYWVATEAWKDFDSRYWDLVTHTLILASSAAVITVTVAVTFNVDSSLPSGCPESALPRRSLSLGYAMPGSLLAVAIMGLFGTLDNWLVAAQETLGFDPETLASGESCGTASGLYGALSCCCP